MTETAPEGFCVERVTGSTTISWGASSQVKKPAAKVILLWALVWAFLCASRGDYLLVTILWLPVLGCLLYVLLALRANRTTIRANDTKWIFRRGPLPMPGPDFGWTHFEKRIDPTRFCQVTSSVAVEEEARSRGLIGLLEAPASHITYDLCMKARQEQDLKVLSGLNGEQVKYLVQVLQPLLAREESDPGCTDARPAEMWSLGDEEGHSLAGPAEVGPVTATPRILEAYEGQGAAATRHTDAEESPVVCSACSESNPGDSAFCGECGAPMVAAEV